MFFKKKKYDIQFDFSDCWCIEPLREVSAFESPEFLYIEPPQVDPYFDESEFEVPVFIDALQRIMPSDAILFLEGAPTTSHVAEALDRIEIETSINIENAGTWPRIRFCHVPFTAANVRILASLFELNEPHCVCNHFHVYADRRMLLYWHDAFSNPFFMACEFDEQKIARFCKEIGCKYTNISE